MKQIVPATICPRVERKGLQRSSTFCAPELLLLLHALIEHEKLQLVLDSCAYLDQLMAVNQQLAMIPHLRAGNPDARKASLDQEFQNVSGVSPVRLLLPDVAGTDLSRISDPHLMAKPLQQLNKPLIVADRFDPHECRRCQCSIESLRFTKLQQARTLLADAPDVLPEAVAARRGPGRPKGSAKAASKAATAPAVKKRTMSAEGKARIVAAQKARWAKLKQGPKKAAKVASKVRRRPSKQTGKKAVGKKAATTATSEQAGS